MDTKRLLFLSFFLLVGWTPAAHANRPVCGVELGSDRRCYRELRRLVKGCQEEPVICGRSYKYGPLPNLEEVSQRCKLWHRNHRRKWVTGLCGIRLYSAPRTFCGRKGMEVAISCIRNVRATQTGVVVPTFPATTAKITPRQAPTAPPAPEAARTPVVAPRIRPILRSVPEPSPSTNTHEDSPKTGSVAIQPAPVAKSSQGSAFWLWSVLLQLLTLCLVIFLLQIRQTNTTSATKARDRFQEEDEWEVEDAPAWQEDKNLAFADIIHEVQRRIDQSTEHLEKVIAQQNNQQPQSSHALIQREADDLLRYYSGIARVILQENGSLRPTEYQQRMIDARDRLQWIFQGHREHHLRALSLHNFQEEALALIDSLIERTGYIDLPQYIQQSLTQGQFSFREYLHRVETDQAEYIRREQPPQTYKDIREAFLARLENLYRNNLQQLQKQPHPSRPMNEEDQVELYQHRYLRVFLLKDMPRQLRNIARQSSPGRIGALVDMLLQFIEDQVQQAGIHLAFPNEEGLEETMLGRLYKFEKARIVEEKEDIQEDSNSLQELDDAFGALSLSAPSSDSASHTLEPGSLPEAPTSSPAISGPDSDPPASDWEAPRGMLGSSELEILRSDNDHTLGTQGSGTNSYSTFSK
ncbi:MAG: hypothetical protein H6727_01750 [Myxococcales bacterium]|nr:hypothetical protein [Myxococcales bacterium]